MSDDHTQPQSQPPRPLRRTVFAGLTVAVGVVAAVVVLRDPVPASDSSTAASAAPPAVLSLEPWKTRVALLVGEPTANTFTIQPAPGRPVAGPPAAVVEARRGGGQILGIGWRTASVTVTAGASRATASTLGLGAAPQRPGDELGGPCVDTITSQDHPGTATDPTVTVTVTGTTAEIRIAGPGAAPAQTITVPLATCPPPGQSDTTTPPAEANTPSAASPSDQPAHN